MSKTSLGMAIALALTIPLTVVAPEVFAQSSRSVARALEPGQLIPGKGIFLGVWSPKDRDGNSLNKTFNVFAAPYDLGLDENGRGTKQLLKYDDAVKAVSDIRGLMGHDGANYKNDSALYPALGYGSYKGEWFIPTRDLIVGTNIDGKRVQTDTLFAHKDKGAFNNTFALVANGSDHAHSYWSCSEERQYPDVGDARRPPRPPRPPGVFTVRMFERVGLDQALALPKDELYYAMSTRLVRAELRP